MVEQVRPDPSGLPEGGQFVLPWLTRKEWKQAHAGKEAASVLKVSPSRDTKLEELVLQSVSVQQEDTGSGRRNEVGGKRKHGWSTESCLWALECEGV